MNTIMNAIKSEIANTTLTETENGAIGYKRQESDLVTFFFAVGSMRNWEEERIVQEFRKAYAENPYLAMRMLFYVRDIRGGIGERRTFRAILASLDDSAFEKLVKLVPEYGRWDDLVPFLAHKDAKFNIVHRLMSDQLADDCQNMNAQKSISLLAKWMPSASKVSKDKVQCARNFYNASHWTEKKYRQTLSALRAYLKVVECNMCSNNWHEINYSAVPSKANLNYSKAFLKHDEARRTEFLESVKKGEKKLNVSALMPYDIVHAYGFVGSRPNPNDSLEVAWQEYSKSCGELSPAIVVRDGSGSMTVNVGQKAQTTALEVATSLAILMSEHLPDGFKDKFITFSKNPQFVDLSNNKTLMEKLQHCYAHDECENTDVEKVMDLVLSVVVKNSMPQDQIPPVVIISDMEFDAASSDRYAYYRMTGMSEEEQKTVAVEQQKTLFETIGEKWRQAGYALPKMVFWNVNSRTNAVPIQTNENGLVLVSGFSPSVFDMVERNGSPIDILAATLMAKRYDAVSDALNS